MKTLRRSKGKSPRVTRCKGRRGAATVELAVVAPILVLLLLGTIDVGQFVNVGQTVSNASREGARVAARNDTLNVSEVEISVLGYLANSFPGVPPSALGAAVQVNVGDANGAAIPGGNLGGRQYRLPRIRGSSGPVRFRTVAQCDQSFGQQDPGNDNRDAPGVDGHRDCSGVGHRGN